MKLHSLLLGILLLPLAAGAEGLLDEFESDVDFLDKSYDEVKKAGVKSMFRDEYRRRITMAVDRAYKLQRSAQKLGIPRGRSPSTCPTAPSRRRSWRRSR